MLYRYLISVYTNIGYYIGYNIIYYIVIAVNISGLGFVTQVKKFVQSLAYDIVYCFLPNWLIGLGPTKGYSCEARSLVDSSRVECNRHWQCQARRQPTLPSSHVWLHPVGLFTRRPKARCCPLDIQGHCFRNKNPKVHSIYHIHCIQI